MDGEIDVFVSKFKPMKNTISGVEEKTLMKIIVEVETDRVRDVASWMQLDMSNLGAPTLLKVWLDVSHCTWPCLYQLIHHAAVPLKASAEPAWCAVCQA